jgi:2-polyprenyl-6-methoxyphenol hydroxylase-like FAD-dependent oxidoreductase
MERIGIVGAGVAGLHLALYLQQRGLPARLYAERTPDEQRVSRLPSTPAHFGITRTREAALGVNHWDAPEILATRVIFSFGGAQPFGFRAELESPSAYLDHRLYVATLLDDYLARGGKVTFGPVPAAAISDLAAEHDVVVVAAGRGGLADLFPVVPERSPLDAPAGFNQEVLTVLREYFPAVYERVTPSEFGVMGPMDILQGALRPCVRRPYTAVPGGRSAVAIGDAHATHDPVAAQGVNSASAGAFILGELIEQDGFFDERFCRKLEARLWSYLEDVTAWARAWDDMCTPERTAALMRCCIPEPLPTP